MIYYEFLKSELILTEKFVNSCSLEYRDIRILKIIYLNSLNEMYLTLSDIIEIKDLGSRATIHRGLYRMRRANVIDFFCKADSYKVKYLKPANEALNYFNKLEQNLRVKRKN